LHPVRLHLRRCKLAASPPGRDGLAQVQVGECPCWVGRLRKVVSKKGETAMSDSGKKDKGKKEQKKKPEHNLKEKRKLKNEKKRKDKFMTG
jgi:hypothetical protein